MVAARRTLLQGICFVMSGISLHTLRKLFINSRLQVFIFSSFFGNPHSGFSQGAVAPFSFSRRAILIKGRPLAATHTEESAGQGCRESRGEWSGFPERFA